MPSDNFFVTGIDTDSGKTLVSAILCETWGYDYWKPVQCGLPRDAETVRTLVSNPDTTIHPETWLLNTPASPHAAAKIDGVEIALGNFKLPTHAPLIIEGAGGCLVPLNDQDLMVDLMLHLKARVILVSDLYLGSINHTLLSAEALRQRNIPVAGIIFNGPSNLMSESAILRHTGLPCLLRIDKESSINPSVVRKYAHQVKVPN